MSKKYYAMALEDLCSEILVEADDLVVELRRAMLASTSRRHNALMRSLTLLSDHGAVIQA